ncbi:MAG TPA: DUF4349 domain-containing protein [Leptolyngbyaceae cyanobacterium]
MSSVNSSPASWRLILCSVLVSTVLSGCGSVPSTLSRSQSEAGSMPASEAADMPQSPTPLANMDTATAKEGGMLAASDGESNARTPDAAPTTPKSAPQLIKQASLTLILSDVDQGVESLSQLTQQLQGDMLALQDWQPQENNTPRQITLTLRIPQQNLEKALEQIRLLGDVQQQSITATDVSDQLVDLEARLRNLRQSEVALLKIMDRSGKISEVLEVSRELSNVRESIERIDAQQQQLKRQVAYSTVNLTLTSAIAASPNPRPLGETLGSSWQSATHSVGTVTVGLLKLSLWLLAYSPYLAAIAGIAFLGHRWHRQGSRMARSEE